MVDDNPSVETETEVTPADNMAELADLLDAPTPEPVEKPQEEAPTEDDPDGLEEVGEDVETETEDPEDGQEDIKGGRFAPDTAKVKLDDGSVISVADLKVRVDKRVKDFQRDYTSKSTALSAKEKQVDQYAQSLNIARDWLEQIATKVTPENPGPWTGSKEDYVGFIEWQQKDAAWRDYQQSYQTFQYLKQQEDQRKSVETEAQARERYAKAAEILRETYPILKDAAKGPQFLEATARDAKKYFELTDDELRSTIQDHRLFKVLRSAIERERLKATAPKVQAEVQKRPVMKSGKRVGGNVQDTKARQQRLEQLRRNPTLENGAASLMDFDL